jgi:hypothetical protein
MGGRAWTPEEDQIVRDIHASENPVEECVDLLIDRSVDSIQWRMKKLKLGIRTIGPKPWTGEEDAIVREIWVSKGSIKSFAHRLPARSPRSIADRGAALSLGTRAAALRISTYSWVEEEVNRILGEFANLTVQQITARSPASLKRINQILAAGRGSKYYISGWHQPRVTNGGGLAARWTIGAKKDAPKPAPKPHAEHSRNYRARKRGGRLPASPFATIIQQVTA